jgi:hypothetical protein
MTLRITGIPAVGVELQEGEVAAAEEEARTSLILYEASAARRSLRPVVFIRLLRFH